MTWPPSSHDFIPGTLSAVNAMRLRSTHPPRAPVLCIVGAGTLANRTHSSERLAGARALGKHPVTQPPWDLTVLHCSEKTPVDFTAPFQIERLWKGRFIQTPRPRQLTQGTFPRLHGSRLPPVRGSRQCSYVQVKLPVFHMPHHRDCLRPSFRRQIMLQCVPKPCHARPFTPENWVCLSCIILFLSGESSRNSSRESGRTGPKQ